MVTDFSRKLLTLQNTNYQTCLSHSNNTFNTSKLPFSVEINSVMDIFILKVFLKPDNQLGQHVLPIWCLDQTEKDSVHYTRNSKSIKK